MCAPSFLGICLLARVNYFYGQSAEFVSYQDSQLFKLPAWWGFAGQQKRNKLQSVIDRLVRLPYLPESKAALEH